jgi:integrase
MAYFQKLASGKWQAQLQRNGVRTSKAFDTKREAQQWAMEQEAQAKRLKSSYGMSFADAVDKYLKDVSSKKDGAVWEVRRLNALLEMPVFKDLALADVDAPHIAEWRDERLKKVSGSTVVREANLLRNMLNVARLEWKKLPHNPFEGVKMPAENSPRKTVWPWQLIKRVLRARREGKTAEVQDAFHIALRTGMRLGEVLAAPENFDTKRNVVTLEMVVGARKTGSREVPIGRIGARLLARDPFTVGANEASVLFSRLCGELLIEGLTFHDTRATALTHLAKKVDVMTLAKISGHKDLSLLMNVYYRPDAANIAKRI